MPEGDTVLLTARRLQRALAGIPLAGSDLRLPALATVDLTGRTTVEVVSRGKHLLHRLSGDLTLHSHLRMEGTWAVRAAGARSAAGRRHTTRALLWTDEHVAVGDRLGRLHLVRTEDEGRLVGHLGPDVLDPAFDVEEAVRRLSADPDLPVAAALLDQRRVAGLGTIWTSEPLFLARVDPWAPVGRIPQETLREVLDHARTGMLRATRTGLRDRPVPRVFGRRGRPCPRCGTPVARSVVPSPTPGSEQVLSYCPSCQGSRGRSAGPPGSERSRP